MTRTLRAQILEFGTSLESSLCEAPFRVRRTYAERAVKTG
jgi:hypothetical protein